MIVAHFFSKRIFITFLVVEVVLLLLLSLTHVKIFPCEAFVYDSKEGYYNTLCSLTDDDTGEILLFQGEWYDIRPIWSGWVVSLILLVCLPYGVARYLNK